MINSPDCVGQDLLIARVRLAANKCVNYTAYHNLTEITCTQGDGVDIYIWCKLHIHSQIKAECVYTQETPACNQMDLVAAEVNELYIISVGSYLCMQLNKELPLTGNLYHISRIGSTIILVLTLVRC